MKNILIAAFALFLLAGCDNEIDINAPYKEVPFVYGLLEAQNNVQYIRIEKAYQNDVRQTVQQGAQYPDSLYFDTLVVKVRNLNNSGEPVRHFYKSYDFAKKAGFFTSAGYHVYKAVNFKPDIYGKYELSIFNPKSGKTYIAVTEIVESMKINNGRFQNMQPQKTIAYPIMKLDQIGRGAAIHDAYLRFYYKEQNIASGVTDTLYIDYYLEKNVTVNYTFNANRQVYLAPASFFNFLKVNIPNKAGVERRFYKLERHSVSGSTFLKDVIELSQDNGGFIDKKRDYSNISNDAQGIFSSRALDTNTINLAPINPNLTDSFPIYLSEYPKGVPNVPQFVHP